MKDHENLEIAKVAFGDNLTKAVFLVGRIREPLQALAGEPDVELAVANFEQMAELTASISSLLNQSLGILESRFPDATQKIKSLQQNASVVEEQSRSDQGVDDLSKLVDCWNAINTWLALVENHIESGKWGSGQLFGSHGKEKTELERALNLTWLPLYSAKQYCDSIAAMQDKANTIMFPRGKN